MQRLDGGAWGVFVYPWIMLIPFYPVRAIERCEDFALHVASFAAVTYCLMPAPSPVVLSADPLSVATVVRVARDGASVALAPSVSERLAASRAVVDAALGDGKPHYGINTGFGSLSRKRIPAEDLRSLQRNLIRSHAAGIGEPLSDDIVRAMMFLLAASLCRGHSGVRREVVELIVSMLNAGLTPVVPSVGSVGASGDLAPLAAIGLTLIGEGACTSIDSPAPTPTAQLLAAAGLNPLTLEAKEGLAIINGTHLMAARGALLMHDAANTFNAALIATAMSIDACRGTDSFLDPRVHAIRHQPGQQRVAEALRAMLRGSQIIPSHIENDPRVQDPYSLRCAPQVLGAVLDAYTYIRGCIERELGAVTDNPLVFPDSPHPPPDHGQIVSAGNFHGMPLAIPLDVLSIALTHIAGISERRVFWMISAFDAESHLKPYLAPNPGLNSGMMIAQYTAAACCNEMISLCTPASVSNISTSAGIEDYNSFGPRAAAKASRALDLLDHVIAIELFCASEGLEYHRPLKSGDLVEAAFSVIRSRVSRLSQDRPLTGDIELLARAIRRGEFNTPTDAAVMFATIRSATA